MNKAIVFHQIFTGKAITVLDRTSIGAVIHGTATSKDNEKADCVFLLIDKVANPVAIRETEEEVMQALGLKQ